MNGRYSSPPSLDKLNESTVRLAKSLDAMQARIGSEPMPPPMRIAVAVIDLTDEQRLAVCRELKQELGYLPEELLAYEAAAKGRLAK